MRIFTKIILTLSVVFFALQADAQQRYIDPVFDDVDISVPQIIASNYSVIGWVFSLAIQGVPSNTIEFPLSIQTYQPVDDSETGRPLVIYLHTGNFTPFPTNQACGGTAQDSSNVEISTRLAKMGYVVANVNYRGGWLATHPQELLRRFTLINAAYRGVQDVNTYIRFFKRSVEELGNPYGIDPDKIVVWGQGTGGYLSLATSYLNDYPEILTTSDPNKFKLDIDSLGTPTNPFDEIPGDGVFETPMVRLDVNGDINGEADITTVDPVYSAYSGLIPGDTLHKPNYVGYSNDFALAVNLGGALGDSTWINDSEIPSISYHVPSDGFAPYMTDVLTVNANGVDIPIVEVSGSYDVQKILARKGITDIFNTIPEGYDQFANGDDFIGLRSFTGTHDDTSAPWEWTDLENPMLLADDCNGDPVVAKTYIDTIIGFYAPRACVALGLDCFSTSTQDQLDGSYISITPNPAQDYVTMTSTKADIKSYTVYGMDGKVVAERNGLQTRTVTVERDGLPRGIYFIKASFEEGVITQKVMFD